MNEKAKDKNSWQQSDSEPRGIWYTLKFTLPFMWSGGIFIKLQVLATASLIILGRALNVSIITLGHSSVNYQIDYWRNHYSRKCLFSCHHVLCCQIYGWTSQQSPWTHLCKHKCKRRGVHLFQSLQSYSIPESCLSSWQRDRQDY